MIELIKGDCLAEMRKIPDKSIDLVLCDLPYGTTRNKWDCPIPFLELWMAYKRIIKDNGVIVLFGSQPFTSHLVQSNEGWFRYELIWDKQRGCDFLNANRKPLKSHENILIFSKKQPKYNKQYWYSKPYKKTMNKVQSDCYGKYHEAAAQSVDGRRNPLSILSYARDSKRVHPTQKPVALLEYLIKTYSDNGDVVLDNCMGCGSTGVACRNTGRSFIGIEIDEQYFEIAKSRIEDD